MNVKFRLPFDDLHVTQHDRFLLHVDEILETLSQNLRQRVLRELIDDGFGKKLVDRKLGPI